MGRLGWSSRLCSVSQAPVARPSGRRSPLSASQPQPRRAAVHGQVGERQINLPPSLPIDGSIQLERNQTVANSTSPIPKHRNTILGTRRALPAYPCHRPPLVLSNGAGVTATTAGLSRRRARVTSRARSSGRQSSSLMEPMVCSASWRNSGSGVSRSTVRAMASWSMPAVRVMARLSRWVTWSRSGARRAASSRLARRPAKVHQRAVPSLLRSSRVRTWRPTGSSLRMSARASAAVLQF